MTLRDLGEHFREQRVNSPAIKRQVDAAKQLFNKRKPAMTLRDELERVLAMGNNMPTVESVNAFLSAATVLLGTHGSALLEALVDAERYRWLRGNTKEKLINPQNAANEVCPDIRTKWELPTFICSGPVGGYVSFDQAIDRARGGES